MPATSDGTIHSPRSALDRLLFPDKWIYRSRHPRAWVGFCLIAGTWNLFAGISGTLTLRGRKWLGLVPIAAGALQLLGGVRMYQIRISGQHRPQGEEQERR